MKLEGIWEVGMILLNSTRSLKNGRLLVLFNSIIPTSHIPSNFILDYLVGTRASTLLGIMRHITLLGNSCLLENYEIALGTVMIRRIFMGSFVGAQDTCPKSCLLLPRDPDRSVAVR